MGQRIVTRTMAFQNRPFAGDGHSLYVTEGTRAQYRNLRLVGRKRRRARSHLVKGTGGNHDLAASSVPKTARQQTIESGGEFELPASLQDTTVTFDVRRFENDVENTIDNYRAVTITTDGDGEPVNEILGTARVLDQVQYAGGIVRIRFVYEPSRSGIQPTLFRITRTAGPTSPADATLTAVGYGQRELVEIDTPALSDASAYTYTIRAENGAVTADLITGLAVTADATGPTAPTGGITDAR